MWIKSVEAGRNAKSKVHIWRSVPLSGPFVNWLTYIEWRLRISDSQWGLAGLAFFCEYFLAPSFPNRTFTCSHSSSANFVGS